MLIFEPLYDPLMTFNHAINVTFIILVKFQLNWSILKILTFEPLNDIMYGLSWLECHMHIFSQVSA